MTKIYPIVSSSHVVLRFFNHTACAGNPFPSDDSLRDVVDLKDILVRDPSSSYLVEVSGDSMVGAGIFDGDILVVDCSVGAVNHDIILASLNGELAVKRYLVEGGITYLVAENTKYSKIEVHPDDHLEVVGVVIRSIRNHCTRVK